MAIDWTAAPEGTTHGMTVGRGEVRWYRVGDNVECWSVTIGWTQSFFLTKEEFNDAGLHLYEYGEQSELVMLRLQHEALMEAANRAIAECNRGSSGRLILEAGDEEALRSAIAFVGRA